jgi:hypothetical protein
MSSSRIGAPALVAFALLSCACASSQRVSMHSAPREFTANDYDDVYDAWTRSADGFDFGQFQDVLNVTSTFEAWEFRWAYVTRYANDFSLSQEARTEMLRATLLDAESHHRFFVTMAGRNFRESDLTREQSAWRVILLDELGRQEAPSEIDHVMRPGAREREYFPSITSFRQTFRITFPANHADGTPVIAPNASHVILRFTGPEGTVDLRWDFQGV